MYLGKVGSFGPAVPILIFTLNIQLIDSILA